MRSMPSRKTTARPKRKRETSVKEAEKGVKSAQDAFAKILAKADPENPKP